MLLTDLRLIGEKLYNIRRERGLTRVEVAEKAGLSDRTYADIERGTVNMRIETALKICAALDVTPNDFLIEGSALPEFYNFKAVTRLEKCSEKEKETALRLLSVYLDSLDSLDI